MLSPAVSRFLWLAFLILIVVFGYKARDNIEVLFAGVGRLDVAPSSDRKTVVMRWSGTIDAPMEQRIAEAYDTYGATAETFVLALSSPGGAVDHGSRVVRLLQRIADTHRLETIVERRRTCASMCVPIYLQGEKRSASSRAQFMFHYVSFSDFFSDEAIDVPASARERATRRFFDSFFRPAGVPAKWIAGILRQMSDGDDVWKSGEALVKERAGIVQSIF